jgi:hypothetical protein
MYVQTHLNHISSITNRNDANSKNIIGLLEKIKDKQYNNSSEVVSATGLVNH